MKEVFKVDESSELKNGQDCLLDGDCLTGFCRDSKCYNIECGAPGRTCSSGTCLDVTNGDDAPIYSGRHTCDANAQCTLKAKSLALGSDSTCAVMDNKTLKCLEGNGFNGSDRQE